MSYHRSKSILAIAWFTLAAFAGGCASMEAAKIADRPIPHVLLKTEQKVEKAVQASNVRAWSPDQALLAHAEFAGDLVTIRNVRNCTYFDADTYVLKYYDRTLQLTDVESVDFLVMPFAGNPLIAHTMLSFGLADGSYLGVSVEIRKEDHEAYGTLAGFFNQYEIMYVIGDERDLIELCTNHLATDVYLYRTKATPAQSQALLVDVLLRANTLRAEPEFYNTITNNCTTNIARHVNSLAPGKVPYDLGVILPGLADRAAYDLGLLATELSFEETKRRAYVTKIAQQHAHDPDFSRLIRQR